MLAEEIDALAHRYRATSTTRDANRFASASDLRRRLLLARTSHEVRSIGYEVDAVLAHSRAHPELIDPREHAELMQLRDACRPKQGGSHGTGEYAIPPDPNPFEVRQRRWFWLAIPMALVTIAAVFVGWPWGLLVAGLSVALVVAFAIRAARRSRR